MNAIQRPITFRKCLDQTICRGTKQTLHPTVVLRANLNAESHRGRQNGLKSPFTLERIADAELPRDHTLYNQDNSGVCTACNREL
jgi:hypothetical protein